jgi:hypothetical protein
VLDTEPLCSATGPPRMVLARHARQAIEAGHRVTGSAPYSHVPHLFHDSSATPNLLVAERSTDPNWLIHVVPE